MKLTNEQKEFYYGNKELADDVVSTNVVEHGQIVYGARAVNAQLPPHLQKHTEDWDIYSKKPHSDAVETEKELDESYGGDFFYVKPAKHVGTYKVKSKVTQDTIADYTQKRGKVPTINSLGVSYTTLSFSKKKFKQSLKNKENRFRWVKDNEVLQRIGLAERRWNFGGRWGW